MENKVKFITLILFILVFLSISPIYSKEQIQSPSCGDGTLYGACSGNKPYFCVEENKSLVERASVCGCNNLSWQSGEACISRYESYPKDITLKYLVGEEQSELDFTVYGQMADYLSKFSRAIEYNGNEQPSRADFKLKEVNEEEQRELLLPLVVEIQNLEDDKVKQARIAVSLVQNIPYGLTEKTVLLPSGEINYSKYPYEVLYYNEGICGEKSALLAFLLKELGYGVSIFYFPEENHEAVVIKCPMKKSFRESGYCFVETSGNSIISDYSMEYVGDLRLISEPEIMVISDGISLPEKMPEYKDAKTMKNIRNKNILSIFNFWKADDIKEKYGLVEEYQIE